MNRSFLSHLISDFNRTVVTNAFNYHRWTTLKNSEFKKKLLIGCGTHSLTKPTPHPPTISSFTFFLGTKWKFTCRSSTLASHTV